MRVWLKFKRSDSLSFISHLDTHKAYYRLFRRAGLPLALSQGFNPHPIMSLAAPLPLGFASNADYVDVTLAEDMPAEEIVSRIKAAPGHENMQFQGLRVITGKISALAALVAWGEYHIILRSTENAQAALAIFADAPIATFIKETKRGSRQADAKQLVAKLRLTEQGIEAILSLSEPVVFRPEELVAVLNELLGGEKKLDIEMVIRQELYVRGEGLFTPLDVGFNGE